MAEQALRCLQAIPARPYDLLSLSSSKGCPGDGAANQELLTLAAGTIAHAQCTAI